MGTVSKTALYPALVRGVAKRTAYLYEIFIGSRYNSDRTARRNGAGGRGNRCFKVTTTPDLPLRLSFKGK